MVSRQDLRAIYGWILVINVKNFYRLFIAIWQIFDFHGKVLSKWIRTHKQQQKYMYMYIWMKIFDDSQHNLGSAVSVTGCTTCMLRH